MPDLSQFKIDVDLPERQRQAMQFLANALSSLEQNGISVTWVAVNQNNYLIYTQEFDVPISVTK